MTESFNEEMSWLLHRDFVKFTDDIATPKYPWASLNAPKRGSFWSREGVIVYTNGSKWEAWIDGEHRVGVGKTPEEALCRLQELLRVEMVTLQNQVGLVVSVRNPTHDGDEE